MAIEQNKLVQVIYKCIFYFDVGKAQLGKITNPMNEISALIIILTMFVGINLIENRKIFGIIIFVGIISITLLGYFFKKSGLWDVEQKINAMKNPVTNELYQAAKKINK